ncbi:hypothetical protein [Paenibacillus ginsengarvi]|uniref:Protein kinase domain-containing protein n=1 Tax=Paenibacillus ginsengarvi TaxID=400777 RepID=A0A3B0AWE9_9BACL|nr:hypothetical protein [Paenibacillus ginsengarvi]RKN64598.1 hypothetical protein D7M11_33680 [Paenibacillus ginsengarvi]
MNKKIKRMISGQKVVGGGMSRIVYDLGNGYVLKIAQSKDGIISNKREVTIYKSAPLILKKHLGHIKKYGDGYSWIVMKGYHLNFKKTDRIMRKLITMKADFRKYGIIPSDITSKNGNPNNKNIRRKPNGEIVIIDYGDFEWRKATT